MLSPYSSFIPLTGGRVVVRTQLSVKFSLHNVIKGQFEAKLQHRSDLALPGEDVGGGEG